MIIEGRDANYWKPFLKEWAKLAKVSQNKFNVEMHKTKKYPSGRFCPAFYHQQRHFIELWFNPAHLEDCKYVFLHELGHLKQRESKRNKKHMGYGKNFELRATKFALSLGCKPEGNYHHVKEALSQDSKGLQK